MSARSVEVPFIDREASLARLREVSGRPDGVCLLVVGRQGIGKSRLLKHFAQVAEEESAGALICVRHETYRSGTSLHDFARLEQEIADHPIVRGMAAGEDREWTPFLNRWLRDSVAALDPTPGKALGQLPVEHVIREMLLSGAPLDEGHIVDNLLRTIRHVAQLLGADRRLVLLLDPSSNLDESSLDLRKLRILYDVIRNLPGRCVLVVALRDTDPSAHNTDFLVLPNVEVYKDLEPFELEDVHALLKTVLGDDLPLRLAQRVHRKYGGDPFATEMAILCAVRTPAPREALVDRCPDKLLQLMEIYHDGFSDPLERRTLRALAIFEEPPTLDLLWSLLNGSQDRETLLRILRSPEMSRAVLPVPSGETKEGRFRIYHEAFAEFLRARADQYGEAEELNRKAGSYYAAAGNQALALFHFAMAGHTEGIRTTLAPGLEWHRMQGEGLRLLRLQEILHRQALSAGDRFLVDKAAAWARSLAGEVEEVIDRVEELLGATEEESLERAELLLLRGDSYHNASRYEESYRDFTEARRLLEGLGATDTFLYRQVLLEAAHLMTHLGDFRSSEALHGQLLATQRFPETSGAGIQVLVQAAREIRRYGELLVFTGQWEEAERLLQLARREFAHLGHRRGEGDALRRIADLHLLRGGRTEYMRALQTARRAHSLLTEVGSRGASFMSLVIGEAYRGLERLDEARTTFQAAHEEFVDGDSPHLLSMAEIALAECERLATGTGQPAAYGPALGRYQAMSSEWGTGTTLFYRGLAHLTAGDRPAATADLAQVREIFTRLDLAPPLAAIEKVLAQGDAGFFPLVVL